MKTNLVNLALGLAFTAGTVSCQSQKNNPVFEHQGDTMTVVRIASPAKYLLLPVQESSSSPVCPPRHRPSGSRNGTKCIRSATAPKPTT